MPIALIHPPLGKIFTGGNIYNLNILHQAKKQDFNCVSVQQTDGFGDNVFSGISDHQLLIWDSLFWHDLDLHSQRLSTTNSALLCHYLPSLNPSNSLGRQKFLQKLETRVILTMRFIITTGEIIHETLKQRFPDTPIFVCEPGVAEVFSSSNRSSRKSHSAIQLLTVANLLPEKGYLQLLQILSAMPDCVWRWHIVGSEVIDIEFTRLFWKTAEQLKLKSRISFHKAMPASELAALMADCDIFVFASFYEAYGMVVAEAAARRMPILTTQVGAAGELIDHGKNGFLVAVGDWQHYSECLQKLILDKKLRSDFQRSRKNRVRSWRQCFDEFKSICLQHVIF